MISISIRVSLLFPIGIKLFSSSNYYTCSNIKREVGFVPIGSDTPKPASALVGRTGSVLRIGCEENRAGSPYLQEYLAGVACKSTGREGACLGDALFLEIRFFLKL